MNDSKAYEYSPIDGSDDEALLTKTGSDKVRGRQLSATRRFVLFLQWALIVVCLLGTGAAIGYSMRRPVAKGLAFADTSQLRRCTMVSYIWLHLVKQ